MRGRLKARLGGRPRLTRVATAIVLAVAVGLATASIAHAVVAEGLGKTVDALVINIVSTFVGLALAWAYFQFATRRRYVARMLACMEKDPGALLAPVGSPVTWDTPSSQSVPPWVAVSTLESVRVSDRKNPRLVVIGLDDVAARREFVCQLAKSAAREGLLVLQIGGQPPAASMRMAARQAFDTMAEQCGVPQAYISRVWRKLAAQRKVIVLAPELDQSDNGTSPAAYLHDSLAALATPTGRAVALVDARHESPRVPLSLVVPAADEVSISQLHDSLRWKLTAGFQPLGRDVLAALACIGSVLQATNQAHVRLDELPEHHQLDVRLGLTQLEDRGVVDIEDDGVVRFRTPAGAALARARAEEEFRLGFWPALLTLSERRGTLLALSFQANVRARSGTPVPLDPYAELLERAGLLDGQETTLEVVVALWNGLKETPWHTQAAAHLTSWVDKAWRDADDQHKLPAIAGLVESDREEAVAWMWRQVIPPASAENSYVSRRELCRAIATASDRHVGGLLSTWEQTLKDLPSPLKGSVNDATWYPVVTAAHLAWIVPQLLVNRESADYAASTARIFATLETICTRPDAEIAVEPSWAEGLRFAAVQWTEEASEADLVRQAAIDVLEGGRSWLSRLAAAIGLGYIAARESEPVAAVAVGASRKARNERSPLVRAQCGEIKRALDGDIPLDTVLWQHDFSELRYGGFQLDPNAHRILGAATLLVNFAEAHRDRADQERREEMLFAGGDSRVWPVEAPRSRSREGSRPLADIVALKHRRVSPYFVARAEALSRTKPFRRPGRWADLRYWRAVDRVWRHAHSRRDGVEDPTSTRGREGLPVPDTLEELIAQVLVVAHPKGGQLDSRWVYHLGGIFVSRKDDVQSLQDLRKRSGLRPFIAVDEEGGRVSWLKGDPESALSAHELAAQGPERVHANAYSRGLRLKEAGVDVDFAPVVDLYPGRPGGVVGDRAYSSDPDEVTELARACAAGLHDAGVFPTLKHFPGHGLASGDTHLEEVATDPLSTLTYRDLIPYRRLIAEKPQGYLVMMGHLSVPGLTEPGRPASLDPHAYALLRDQIGHAGLVITDELFGMDAVSSRYSRAASVVAAISAGADLALIGDSTGLDALIEEIRASVENGQLPIERLRTAATNVIRVKLQVWWPDGAHTILVRARTSAAPSPAGDLAPPS